MQVPSFHLCFPLHDLSAPLAPLRYVLRLHTHTYIYPPSWRRLEGGTLHIAFDAATGQLSHFIDKGGGDVSIVIKGSAAAMEAAAIAGIKLLLEQFVCDVRSMSCYWQVK